MIAPVARRLALLAAGALCAAVLGAAPAAAEDPGRWSLVRVSTIPLLYYQGVADGPPGSLSFSGFVGICRTDLALRQTAANRRRHPPGGQATPRATTTSATSTWDAARGRRGCCCRSSATTPGSPNGGNTCAPATGSIGVADPGTLAWRYYVKLDPAEITKAMWVEASPDGSLCGPRTARTCSRYALADITPANAAPSGRAIRPVRRLSGAVPPSGITGATFHGGRLFVAGQGGRAHQVWSIDLATGARRLEIERADHRRVRGPGDGEARGGLLHWQVMPFAPGADAHVRHRAPARC